MHKMNNILFYFFLWRTVPAYIIFHHNKFCEKCRMDLEEWTHFIPNISHKNEFYRFGYLLLFYKECRNIFLNRLHRNPVMFIITRILFPPLESCHINMPPEKIGGGFALQHGFSTIIAAKEIGTHCHINQQVTIGYVGNDAPIIGDHVLVAAGAIVIGDIHIGNGSRIGAGAVVVHDVPDYATVVGPAAQVVKIRNP